MKIVVVLSGGHDSSTLLQYHLEGGDEVRAISVNYGQRHYQELKYAKQACSSLAVPWTLCYLPSLAEILPGSSQTSDEVPVPHGKYDEESMKATVVPNRNMILLSLAIGHAVAHKFEAVSYAAHAGDHAIYPDCREEFVVAMEEAAKLCDWVPIRILRPFIRMSKAQIVALGDKLGVDASRTYSCYEGGEMHCGRCGTCVERILAFQEAGVFDPLPYQYPGFYKQFLPAK